MQVEEKSANSAQDIKGCSQEADLKQEIDESDEEIAQIEAQKMPLTENQKKWEEEYNSFYDVQKLKL